MGGLNQTQSEDRLALSWLFLGSVELVLGIVNPNAICA